jgi:hypothetical protein
MSSLKRKRKAGAKSSIDDRLAALDRRKQSLMLAKTIQELRQKQKDLKK